MFAERLDLGHWKLRMSIYYVSQMLTIDVSLQPQQSPHIYRSPRLFAILTVAVPEPY
jgi:hypothetical protein